MGSVTAGLTRAEQAHLCKTCGKPYVVPSLARDCEQHHTQEETP